MHFYDEPTGVTINHNSDLSGSVIISVPSEITQAETRHFTELSQDYHMAEMHVPGNVLLEFVLSYLHQREIGALEDLNYKEILQRYSGKGISILDKLYL